MTLVIRLIVVEHDEDTMRELRITWWTSDRGQENMAGMSLRAGTAEDIDEMCRSR